MTRASWFPVAVLVAASACSSVTGAPASTTVAPQRPRGSLDAIVQSAEPSTTELCFGGIAGPVGASFATGCSGITIDDFDWSTVEGFPASATPANGYRWASARLTGEFDRERGSLLLTAPPLSHPDGPSVESGRPARPPDGFSCTAPPLPTAEEEAAAVVQAAMERPDRPVGVIAWLSSGRRVATIAPSAADFAWMCANGLNPIVVPVVDLLVPDGASTPGG